jgi:ribosomal protein S27AE
MVVFLILFISIAMMTLHIIIGKSRLAMPAHPLTLFPLGSENQIINTPKTGRNAVLEINKHQAPALSSIQPEYINSEPSTKSSLESPEKTQKRSTHSINEPPADRYEIELEHTGNENGFCPNCGNYVDEHDKFCIFCGFQL